MLKNRKALILVNVGTPESPGIRSVKSYLSEFLNDKRVIDLPWLLRKVLVNMIIIPFRVKKSTHLYNRLWTEEGSPLLLYLKALVDKVNGLVPDRIDVFGAMRYGNPSLATLLEKLKDKGYSEIKVLPLYPQYAESTTGSVIDLVHTLAEKKEIIPRPLVIEQFWSRPSFIESLAGRINACSPGSYDHIIFSYHGLPVRQIKKIHPDHKIEGCICEKEMPAWGKKCYKAACYGTTRLLAEKLSLESDRYTTSFQSRLTRNWLSPFTDELIVSLAESGSRRLLVVAPSFVADCLETTVEIGIDYNELFKKHGGEELVLVEGLNDDPAWAEALVEISDIRR